MIKQYSKLLDKTFHYKADPQFDDRVGLAALSIIENNSNGRDDVSIFENLLIGFAAEHALESTLGILNPNKFNHKESCSYNYDIISDDIKFEIKSYLLNDDDHLKGTWCFSNNLDTYLENYSKVDFVIYCSVKTKDFENFEVKPRLIVNSKTFPNYIGYGKTKFYKNGIAESDGECIRIKNF